MKRSHPPKLALTLLRRYVPDNEPLVGDLLEEFAVRRSRSWFWRQAFLAILIRSVQPRDREHPLGLSPSQCPPVPDAAPLPRHVNLTASPLPGIGGLGLVGLGLLVAIARPNAWWIFVPAVAAGLLLGLLLVLVRRRQPLPGRVTHVGSGFSSR
jgi:hypothetical protein